MCNECEKYKRLADDRLNLLLKWQKAVPHTEELIRSLEDTKSSISLIQNEILTYTIQKDSNTF